MGPVLTYAFWMRPSTMRVRVFSCASLKSRFPEGGQVVELSEGDSVARLLERLGENGQVSEAMLRSAAVAVNQEYAPLGLILNDGDEVAILPPVSGGSPEGPVELVVEPIEARLIVEALKAGADGAVVVFDGIVRDNTRGRQTLHLDYEAYEEMALKQMRELRM